MLSVFESQLPYNGRIPQGARCFRCRSPFSLHRHHIFNGPLRNVSEREGLWCYLCAEDHTGKFGIHANRTFKGHEYTDAEHLKWHAQKAWEKRYMREHDASEDEARIAWANLTKVLMPSYEYVEDDDHQGWLKKWKH